MNTSIRHSPFQLYFNGVLGFLVIIFMQRKINSIKDKRFKYLLSLTMKHNELSKSFKKKNFYVARNRNIYVSA